MKVKLRTFLALSVGAVLIAGTFFGLTVTHGQADINARRRTVNKVGSVKPNVDKRDAVRAMLKARQSDSLGNPCTTTTPITVGQTLNGNLATGDCQLEDSTFIDYYSFSGQAGQAVVITQNSAALDTYVYLFDNDDNILEENDDSGTGTDSRVPVDEGVVILPYTGNYVIGANSFAPGTGAYSVSLTSSAACATAAVVYNQPVNGSLATTDCNVNLGGDIFYTDLFTFQGTAGDQIAVSMNSTAVDSFLILHPPTGASIEDNNGGGGSNARIPVGTTLLTLTATGTYVIEASSFNPTQSGTYALTVTGPQSNPPAMRFVDFDGDAKTDISIFRPAVGEWWLTRSSNSSTFAAQFGNSADKPVAADFTGDGKTDVAFFRPSNGNWFVLRSEDSNFYAFPFGANGDIPLAGDFDGDGIADPGVFRPSSLTWFISKSTGGTDIVAFGAAGDKPVIADYDGDGKADIAIFRPGPGEWWVRRSSNGSVFAAQFGATTDRPVPGDYTGDGKADLAFFRPSNGNWFILRSEDSLFFAFPFGGSGDIPAPGDYDGDGRFDAAVFRPSQTTWFISRSTAGILITSFGNSADIPVSSAFVP